MFHLPHMRIIGMHNCDKERRGIFKCQGKQHNVLCQNDYVEGIVSSFAHQIQSEY